MHNAGIVVGGPQVVRAHLPEVGGHSRVDVVQVDGHVTVPVLSLVLVAEAGGVVELVLDNAGVEAPGPDGELLVRAAGTAHHGPAPAALDDLNIVSDKKERKKMMICMTSLRRITVAISFARNT